MKVKMNSAIFHIIAGTLIIVAFVATILSIIHVVLATGVVYSGFTCAKHLVGFLICMPISLLTIKSTVVFFKTYRYD